MDKEVAYHIDGGVAVSRTADGWRAGSVTRWPGAIVGSKRKRPGIRFIIVKLAVVPLFIASICHSVLLVNGWLLLQKVHPFVGGTPVLVHGVQQQRVPLRRHEMTGTGHVNDGGNGSGQPWDVVPWAAIALILWIPGRHGVHVRAHVRRPNGLEIRHGRETTGGGRCFFPSRERERWLVCREGEPIGPRWSCGPSRQLPERCAACSLWCLIFGRGCVQLLNWLPLRSWTTGTYHDGGTPGRRGHLLGRSSEHADM